MPKTKVVLISLGQGDLKMSGVNVFSFQERKRRQIGAECKRFRKSVLQIGGYTDVSES